MVLNEHHVRTSVLNYFAVNYSGSFELGDPQRFDPEAESTESWAIAFVDTFSSDPDRVKKIFHFRVVVQCRARTNADIYAASRIAGDVADALRGKQFSCQDFDESLEPVLGSIRLYEPKVHDETTGLSEEGWQHINVIVAGKAQETA